MSEAFAVPTFSEGLTSKFNSTDTFETRTLGSGTGARAIVQHDCG